MCIVWTLLQITSFGRYGSICLQRRLATRLSSDEKHTNSSDVITSSTVCELLARSDTLERLIRGGGAGPVGQAKTGPLFSSFE